MLLETLGEPVSGGLVTGEKSGPLRQGRRGVRSVFWPLGLSRDRPSVTLSCPVATPAQRKRHLLGRSEPHFLGCLNMLDEDFGVQRVEDGTRQFPPDRNLASEEPCPGPAGWGVGPGDRGGSSRWG